MKATFLKAFLMLIIRDLQSNFCGSYRGERNEIAEENSLTVNDFHFRSGQTAVAIVAAYVNENVHVNNRKVF